MVRMKGISSFGRWEESGTSEAGVLVAERCVKAVLEGRRVNASIRLFKTDCGRKNIRSRSI